MRVQKIKEFAMSMGYAGVERLDNWRGFEVYEPIPAGAKAGEYSCVGLPLVILVKGEKIRMSTPEEAFQQMKEA